MSLDASKYLNALQSSDYAADLINMKKQRAFQMAQIAMLPDQLKNEEGEATFNIGSNIAEISGGAIIGKIGGAIKDLVKEKVSSALETAKDELTSRIQSVLPEGLTGEGETSLNGITDALASGDISGAINSVKSLAGNVADGLMTRAQGAVGDLVSTATDAGQNILANAQSAVSDATSSVSNLAKSGLSDLESMREGILPEFNQDAMTSRFQSLFGSEFEDGTATLQRAIVQAQSIVRSPFSQASVPEQVGDTEMQNMAGREIPEGPDNLYQEPSIAPTEEAIIPADVVEGAGNSIEGIGSTLSTAAETAVSEATNAAAEGLSSAASSLAEVGTSLAAEAGAEIAGAAAGMGLGDLLGPVGIIGGLIGGGIAIYEGIKKEKEAAADEEQAAHMQTESVNYGFTNPAAQFL